MYGITINFSSDTGTGTHPDDHKVRDFSGKAETDFFTYTITCEAYAYCYANGGWFGFDTAACSIEELKGEGTVTEKLTAKNDPINY